MSVCGQEISDRTLGEIRSAVGLVFQDPDDQLFSPTVFDDVAFGPIYQGLPEGEVRERVAAALSAVGMEDRAQRVSHHLSGGEKKRVAIATVLAMQPEVLVLDEPAAGLDPRARRGLIQLLADLPQTMLVATHDLRLVAELLPAHHRPRRGAGQRGRTDGRSACLGRSAARPRAGTAVRPPGI